MLEKLQNSRNALGLIFMLPAAVLLLLFLTYPLGLGVWLGFTDAKVGRPGGWVGLENYEFLLGDSVTRLALFNTLFYTFVASVLKFFLGLWLAILLNRNIYYTLGKPAAVYLNYSRTLDIIALEPASPRLPESFPVLQTGHGWRINAAPFCRHFGIHIDTTLKFTRPDIIGNALHLKLSETVSVGGSSRKKKRG